VLDPVVAYVRAWNIATITPIIATPSEPKGKADIEGTELDLEDVVARDSDVGDPVLVDTPLVVLKEITEVLRPDEATEGVEPPK
jgi:hypothetical protein